MFTGIIEEIGKMTRIDRKGQAMRLTIEGRKVLEDIHLGDSISVNGVCLTAVSFDLHAFTVDVMPETFRHTNLKDLKAGSPVNLERAMQAGGRFGGHIVQGHVDTVGTIVRRDPEENAVVFMIKPSQPSIMKYIIPKGSVTLDGISLTVVKAESGAFTVSIIPHTLAETGLQHKQPGSTVNIETDILGKYIEHLLHFRTADNREDASSKNSSLSIEYLSEHGFA
jgi:riboflavin synthase